MTTKKIFVGGSGPSNAEVLILGECPTADDEKARAPFVGYVGVELTNMLKQAGMPRSTCYLHHVCPHRPPKNKIESWIYNKTSSRKNPHEPMLGKLVAPVIAQGVRDVEALIEKLQPKIIIALGNLALWSVTGQWGIVKWRGSNLRSRMFNSRTYPVLPTYSPTYLLKRKDWMYIATHDLRTARKIRDNGLPVIREEFIIRPSLEHTLSCIHNLKQTADSLSESKLDLAVDIETRFQKITCVGFAWSESKAICIPFLEIKSHDSNYWPTLEEEVIVVQALRELFTHPKVRIIGQGFSYDQQYFAREMGFVPNYKPENFHDTMTAHHVMFPGLPKGLDFLSSFYCADTHVYWKDEGKEWNPKLHDEEQHWVYNAKDCVRTWLVAQSQRQAYEALNFKRTAYGDPWTIQHSLHESVLRAMLRGVLIDQEKKESLRKDLNTTIKTLEAYIHKLLGHPLNPRSPKQLQTLFYTDFAVKPVTKYDRATGTRKRTCDSDALLTIAKREVLLAPICEGIADVRSLGTSRSICAKDLDTDGRVRCQYTVPGAETYRYTSSEDAFGFGQNLQNVTAGYELVEKTSHLYRPNLKKMFIPDPGYVIADHDLEQADARIVAWEANCASLKEIFNDPSRDLHNENCEIIFGSCSGKDDPNRKLAKAGVHAANYGATPPIIAAALGITNHQAEAFLTRYFGERPEVKGWHEAVLLQLQTKRYVENVFGYRRFYFDRIEDLLKEALAWIPQSTVAIAVNLGIKEVERKHTWAEFLLQVHDSAVHQFPIRDNVFQIQQDFDTILEAMRVPLPYDDPMTIPVAGSWSLESWGHCK